MMKGITKKNKISLMPNSVLFFLTLLLVFSFFLVKFSIHFLIWVSEDQPDEAI